MLSRQFSDSTASAVTISPTKHQWPRQHYHFRWGTVKYHLRGVSKHRDAVTIFMKSQFPLMPLNFMKATRKKRATYAVKSFSTSHLNG